MLRVKAISRQNIRHRLTPRHYSSHINLNFVCAIDTYDSNHSISELDVNREGDFRSRSERTKQKSVICHCESTEYFIFELLLRLHGRNVWLMTHASCSNATRSIWVESTMESAEEKKRWWMNYYRDNGCGNTRRTQCLSPFNACIDEITKNEHVRFLLDCCWWRQQTLIKYGKVFFFLPRSRFHYIFVFNGLRRPLGIRPGAYESCARMWAGNAIHAIDGD